MSDLTNVFTDIADAIRAKTNSVNTYKPTEMAGAINNIPSGGSVTLYAWGPAGSQQRQYYGYTLSPTPSVGDTFFYVYLVSPYYLKKDSEYGVDAYNPSTNKVIWNGVQHPRNSAMDIVIS